MLRRRRVLDPVVRPVFVELTDARSGVSHAVGEPRYAEELAGGAGTFTASCLAQVLPVPMTAGAGSPCPECTAQVRLAWHQQ